MVNKTCYKCQTPKPFSAFAKDARSKDGHQSKCKDCDKAYRLANEARIAEYKSGWSKQPSSRSARAEYKRNNPHICNAGKAKRKAARLQRTPKWLTDLDYSHIQLFYEAAAFMTKETGVEFEVDHIIPLQGKKVSGLHVPCNLQVLTARENGAKGNRY